MSGTSRLADTRPDSHRYDDMVALPHHVSTTHPHMPVIDRAAQFSPFAALTGYEDAVKETARLTDERIELDESVKAMLAEKLIILQEHLPKRPKLFITYFQPDVRKTGGAYVVASGEVKKIDEYKQLLVLTDGTKIPIGELIEMEGELFRSLEREGDGFI